MVLLFILLFLWVVPLSTHMAYSYTFYFLFSKYPDKYECIVPPILLLIICITNNIQPTQTMYYFPPMFLNPLPPTLTHSWSIKLFTTFDLFDLP